MIFRWKWRPKITGKKHCRNVSWNLKIMVSLSSANGSSPTKLSTLNYSSITCFIYGMKLWNVVNLNCFVSQCRFVSDIMVLILFSFIAMLKHFPTLKKALMILGAFGT